MAAVDSRAEPETRTPGVLWICVLALLTAVAPLATDMYLPALPELAADLGTTASAVQLSLTAFLVGLAVGQLVIGPLSDGWGRRRLLLAGTVLCLLAGVGAALAPTIAVLVVARFLQGFGGAAGIVLSRAVISDRTTGNQTVRLFSVMMAINGIAPVVAPLIGGALTGIVGWRGVLGAVAGLALLMVLGAYFVVPETLPAGKRTPGGLRRTGRHVLTALRRRRYVGYTFAFAFSFAAMFAYISGSSFVLQDTLGLTTGQYSIAFGANATALVLSSITSGRLVSRVAPERLLAAGIGALVFVSAALLVVVLLGAPVWPVLVLLFLSTASLGFVLGNGAGLATAQVRDLAGTGSALLGALQFGLGAAVSPLVGSSPLVMAVAMLVASGIAALALGLLTRERVPA
ncbi:multidrug effflux MFS transporter [Pseudonocardia endophytica]|uniref:DHA1 family bicyclomycin/chloramphenicol resistance-like MFS transporter n=1 Tax=Pseudonocardia endophytica TaxID=401976 RepID=A0A4R1HXL7_PSEEN|nr:multidrug effflux MFS transporter [Pseudonocardia endophytica]TCK27534.1 DHA1 family bicyclomycin/chloramphenicol resistance-like MFS transporter [Pseudonocardia endophytica]